jgi:predicted PurR-regulated permease PerM
LRKFSTRKVRSLVPYFLLALAVIIAYKVIIEIRFFADLLDSAWGIVTPFFSGFLLAYIINLPCSAIQRLLGRIKLRFISKRSRGLAIIITYIIFFLILISIFYLILPYVGRSVTHFVSSLPSVYVQIVDAIQYINSFGIIDIDPAGIDGVVQNFIRTYGGGALQDISLAIVGASSAIFIF